MTTIKLLPLVGGFAENKDIAKELRLTTIVPALEKNEKVVLDFDGIEGATQSFIHALISDVVRKFGSDVLDRLYFKGCSKTVQKMINIVTDYIQEAE